MGPCAWAARPCGPAPEVKVGMELSATHPGRFKKALAAAMVTLAALSMAGDAASDPIDTVVTSLQPDTSGHWVRTTEQGPLTIAHRGDSVNYPENTMVGFRAAIAAGAEVIENDVYVSSDGVPVVMHDPTVDRTTDGTGPITSMTSAEIARLDAGSWFSPKFAGEHVPTLAEQLDEIKAHPGTTLLLDIKQADRAQMETIIGEVEQRHMLDQVLLQSTKTQVLVDSYAIEPKLEIALLAPATDDAPALARQYHLSSFNPDWTSLSTHKEIIGELNAMGVGVMAWTVDDPKDWSALAAAGADGVITNRAAEHIAQRR